MATTLPAIATPQPVRSVVQSTHCTGIVDASEDPRGRQRGVGTAPGWYFPAVSALVPRLIGSDGRDH